jgi:LPS-assembly lipoprotein
MIRAVSLALLSALAIGVAGCTVRPLYSDAPVTADGSTANAALSSVLIRPARTRDAQEVRNQLIFLFNGGKAQKPVASGRRQITSQYDIPNQEFAAYRAQRDAENRAARELAELVRLAVAQDLARHTGK